MSDNTLLGMSFIGYLLVIAVLGVLAYRRTKSLYGFLLGDRRLSYWVTALSAGASDMSGWLLLGLPGLAYLSIFESLWVAVGLFIGTVLNWVFVARKLREQSEHYGNALTIPEYFEKRFADDTHILRTVSASFILLFFVFYTAAGFVAGGKLFVASFGLPYNYAVILSASLVVIYTAFGGFLAVAWTDALQAAWMLIALLVVAVLALLHIDSGALTESVVVSNNALLDRAVVSPIVIVSSLAWGLGYFGQPHILARFMAIRAGGEIGAARRIAVAWTAAALTAAIVIGFAGSLLLGAETIANDSERIFMVLVGELLHPLAAGMCLAAILAAIMSTADSQLLIAAAALTHDLLAERKRSESTLVWHRTAVGLICLVAMTMALNPNAKVLELVAYAWAGFGAAIGPSLLMSLYAAETTRWSVLAGMIVGTLTVFAWEYHDDGIFDIYALLPGFVLGLGAIVIVNYIVRQRRDDSVRTRA